MKSQALRSSRFTVNQGRKKKNSSNKLSQSPTLTSTLSQRSLWTHSYKNEPFPGELRRKLWGKKFEFDFSSDDEEQEIAAVVQQEQQGDEKKVKRLPHFKIISDRGEFLQKRGRIRSQVQFRCRQKCKSVQSMKQLPKVQQQKRQDDDLLKKLQRSKLSYFKDKNQFNQQRKRKSSDSQNNNSEIISVSMVQSLQNVYMAASRNQLPEQIEQNQAEQTKSVKLLQQGSIISAQIQKLIVDELDSKKRKDESMGQEISQIIQQQKLQQQDEYVKVVGLRQSLDKFETESQYLKKQLRDDGVSSVRKSDYDEQKRKSEYQQSRKQIQEDDSNYQGNIGQDGIQQQRQKLPNDEYEDIRECSSSGKEDDYLQVTSLSVINQQEPKQQKVRQSKNQIL